VDRRLGGLGLLLAVHVGDEGHMNEGEVVVADAELELTHSLHERRRFNVTDGPSELS
jgi:hypothetical protein